MDVEKKKYVFLICFFVIGTFNNLGYVLIWISSADLANSLNEPNLVSVYMLVMLSLCLLARFLAMKYLIRVNYNFKVLLVSCTMFLGYVSFYLILVFLNGSDQDSKKLGFYLSLVPTSLIGMSNSLGEVVMVGYLKKYPSEWLSGFYGGTGMAGVLGALTKIVFTVTGVNPSIMWLAIAGTSVIYYFCYHTCERIWNSQEKKVSDVLMINDSPHTSLKLEEGKYLLINKKAESLVPIKDTSSNDDTKNVELNFDSLKLVISTSKVYILNIAACYFLSYMIVHLTERYEHLAYIKDIDQVRK